MIKYKCKHCGQIVTDAQRAVHAHRHHPAVPFGKMDIFVGIDFIRFTEATNTPFSDTSITTQVNEVDFTQQEKSTSDNGAQLSKEINGSASSRGWSLREILDDGKNRKMVRQA